MNKLVIRGQTESELIEGHDIAGHTMLALAIGYYREKCEKGNYAQSAIRDITGKMIREKVNALISKSG